MKKLNFIWVPFLLVACNSDSEKEVAVSTPPAHVEIVEETIIPEELIDGVTSATATKNPVTFNGTLVIPPDKFATVSTLLGGTIRNLNLLPGSYVRKGTVLATLENPEFIEIQYSFLESNAQLEYLEAEYNRQKKLSQQEVASQKKYQQSKAEYLSMKSRKQAAEAQLKLLGIDPSSLLSSGIHSYIEIKAPINGYISNVEVNLGKHLNSGETICDLVDKSETMVRLLAYEKDLEQLSTGNRIKFRVNGLDSCFFYATLVSIGQVIDDVSRSMEVYAKVDEKNPLFRPGMYVSAQMEN